MYFTQKAIYLKIPYLTDPDRLITIVVPLNDILKIEMLSGRSMPLLFISTTPSTCERVRKDLNLNFKSSGLYYDLSSVEESMKRITMLPEKMPDEVKTILSGFYSNTIAELDSKTANEMLVKSTPKTSIMQEQQRLQAIKKLDPEQAKLKATAPKIEKYCQYPSTGSNTVSISPEDYYCLEDESFLNDVIIDFYLKWIQNTVIPQESRDRTHIFTTYFYKRLTTRPPRSKNKLHPIEDNVNLSPAEKRYERVRRWTKKVNIFEKDFVIIPINEHSHWFLAVICYPGLAGKCRMDTGESIPDPSGDAKKTSESTAQKSKTPKKKVMQIGSTSIIPLKANSSFHLDDDSDRDEAEASDSDMVIEDDFQFKKTTVEESKDLSKEENSETKDPLEVKEEPETKASEEADQEPGQESETPKETPEQMETEERKEAKETEDSNEAKETEDSKEPMETEKSEESEEAKESVENTEEKSNEESAESKEPSAEKETPDSKTETKVEGDSDSEYKASKYFESGAEKDKEEASNAKPEESQSNGTSENDCDDSVAKPSEKEETKESVIAVKQ